MDGTCDPGLRTDCAAGSEPLPGAQCTATDAARCPSTPFAAVPPEAVGATVAYVLSGASPTGADGSMSHPYATIAAALGASTSPTWLMLGAGTYAEAIDVTRSVHLVGACAAQTTLAPPATLAGVHVGAAGVTVDLRDVTVRGGNNAVFAEGGAHIDLTRVVIDHAISRGVYASGAGTVVNVQDAVIGATQLDAMGQHGRGMQADTQGTIDASRVVVRGSAQCGVMSILTGVLHLRDAVVRSTVSVTSGHGDGLEVGDGSSADATRVVFDDNQEVGVLAFGSGGTAQLADVVVRNTRNGIGSQVDAAFGVSASGGANVHLARALIERNGTAAVYVLDPGTTVTMESSVVRQTRGQSDGNAGYGIDVTARASLTATGVVLDQNLETGAAAYENSTLTLTDSIVRSTRRGPMATGAAASGMGLLALTGATVVATRVRVEDNQDTGALVVGTGSQMSLLDSVVSGTTTSADGLFGRGVEADRGATLVVSRTDVVRNHDIGINVVHTASATISDTAISDTTSLPDGTSGWGLNVSQFASASLERTLVRSSVESGIFVSNENSAATLTDVVVESVTPSRRGIGSGIFVSDAASASGVRVAVQNVSGAGIAGAVLPLPDGTFRAGASLDLQDVFVRGVLSSPIQTDPTAMTPVGAPVAYALTASQGATVTAQRAVLAGAGYGAFGGGGRLSLSQGWITGALNAAAATNDNAMQGLLSLDTVGYAGNARDSVVSDGTLPSAAVLAPPSPVCPPTGCM
jgi:hypothetical protein